MIELNSEPSSHNVWLHVQDHQVVPEYYMHVWRWIMPTASGREWAQGW